MVTEGYHFFKPLRKAAVARPWAGRQAAEVTRGRGGIEDLSRVCVNELGETPSTDAEEGFDLRKAQDRRNWNSGKCRCAG